ncbi:MAG: DNA polymerase I [Anaerolineae bacterium]|nr:DNA polymerase I [Anaerolineae bacterium]
MGSRPLFYIIDGHAVAYRQFFALQVKAFSTRAGEPTNATFGFARTLMDILQKDRPDYIAVSFDRGLSGREDLYPDYKGTREKMPPELSQQLTRIAELVEVFNMPILALDGYEADDVIGSVVGQAEAQGANVRIVTGDRDILQLLTEHIKVQLPKKGEADVVYDMAMFREIYGLEPWQLVELKALMGDSSDNIPGVKGIGEKTATTLLQQYTTIDGIYEHIDDIKGANQQKLIAGRDLAYLSRTLATIQRDVPVTLNLEACVAHDYDVQKVDDLFGVLEFRQLRDRLPRATGQLSLFDMNTVSDAPAKTEDAPPVAETIIVQTEDALAAMVAQLNAAQGIAFDTETTGTDQMAAALVGISLATDGETGFYIPVGHQAGEQLPLKTVIDALRPPLTNPAIGKYGHNAAYDMVMLQRYGLDITPVTFDTMVAEWLRAPDSKFLGLKNLARQELNIHMTEISELIGKGKKQITMDNVPIEKAAPYAAADAATTFRLVENLHSQLAEQNLIPLYETLEMPLIPVITMMERAGVVLDRSYLNDLSERLGKTLAGLEQEIYALSGYGTFNINSPKQLNDVLFGKLGLSVEGLKKTTHGYSTDAAVLESLKGQHPVIERLLEYREVTKLKGTYVDALPELINEQTGRLHTSYNQTGTSTGRISSSDPNLQNIPIRTELGREVRRAFVASAGMKLLSVDYSQVELRILAHISQDRTLLEAFAQGLDIHAATAAAVYGIPVNAITKEQRSFAKRVNFGLIYGMGAYRLARDSELTLAEARAFIKTYFDRLPGVEKYLEETKQQARLGPIQTLFGRQRSFPVLLNASSGGNQVAIQAEERVAINMPIQGTAADIMKRAMINLYQALKASKLQGQMILQVHDELVLEVPEAEVPQTRDLVVRVMEGAYQLDAPLKANAQVGDNWRDMTSI